MKFAVVDGVCNCPDSWPNTWAGLSRRISASFKEDKMAHKSNGLALAIGTGAFLLATSVAQAASEQVIGGSLYVVDLNKPVTFTFAGATDPTHPDVTVYWRDGLDGSWAVLSNPKAGSYTLSPTAKEVFFAIEYTNIFGETFLFSTGNGALNQPSKVVGSPHAVVTYDSVAKTAFVAFEDADRLQYGAGLNDWDDFTFSLTNVARNVIHAPEPETYAMLLAGLGLVGAVARRRRVSGKA
jgi:hypothetical protein